MNTRIAAALAATVTLLSAAAVAAQSLDPRPPVIPSCVTGNPECPPDSIYVDWIDLGSFGGSATANAINAAGHVVGVAHTRFEEETHAFIWTRSTGMRSFGRGVAADINNREEVTGYIAFADGSRAFVWTERTGLRDLGTLGGAFSRGYAINDRGWVAGSSETAASQTHAFLWTPAEGMIDLGTLGGPHSTAYGINLWGQVVGSSMTADLRPHAFSWTPETGMVDLGSGAAFDVNRNGWIVVQQLLPDWSARAVAWTPAGFLTLGQGTAIAINELGDIAWNGWIATLWSWQLGIIDMQVGASQDVNEIGVLAGGAERIDDDTGQWTAALWRVRTGWSAEFSALRRLLTVVESRARGHLPEGTAKALARAEMALQAGNGDAALAALRRVERQLERLTRNGEAPEWYVAAGTLASIIERIEEAVLQKR